MSQADPEAIEVSRETAEKPHHVSNEQMNDVLRHAQSLYESLKHVPDGDMVGNIVNTALKLLRDGTNRGDIKLIEKSMGELRYALKVFGPYRDVRKISVFGSARTGTDAQDYVAAAEFGAKMAARGWMVTTGAGGGIMAAAHGGAGRDPSFGLAIRLPFEQETNEHIIGDKKLVNFRYFFTRKLMFVRTSSAIALFPGGFGTMDEGFEVLTLIQTGKSVPMPIVLVDKRGGQFWVQWQQYVEDQLLARGMISPADMKLYKITDDIDQAVQECCTFYKNYHSLRYIHDELIIRLQKALTEKQLDEIREKYARLKVKGDFEIRAAHRVEADEEEIAHLPRLVFEFNRRDQGGLRELIDHLNTL